MTRTCVLPLLFALAVSGCIHHRTGMIESKKSPNMEWRAGIPAVGALCCGLDLNVPIVL